MDVSPYCTRCTPSFHGRFNHQFHETNEHDEWLEQQEKK